VHDRVGDAGDWVLTSGHGRDGEVPLGDGVRVTLTVDGEAWSGTVCNHYFADGQVRGSEVTVSGVGGTEMACDGPLMEAELIYWAALPEVSTWDVSDGVLTLSGDGVELVYDRVPPVPDADLVGTGAGDQTLELTADGRLSAGTGCNPVGGDYELDGDGLRTAQLIGTLMGCEDALMDQEGHIRTVLEAHPVVEVDGDQLTLTAEGPGRALVYRATPG
jgi:heat shock protein HslJ